MRRYRKRPVVIEAMQYDGSKESIAAVLRLHNRIGILPVSSDGQAALSIPTLEGNMTVTVGDWVIRGIAGELYPCKSNIFEATYESVFEPEVSDDR